MTATATYLDALVRETQKPETEVIAHALQTGLKHLWREMVLGHYVRGEITRDETIDSVGISWVDLADRQYEAMLEDVDWGLEK